MHNARITDTAALPVLSVGIEDAPKILGGVSRTRIFQAVQNNEITIRKNGRSSIVEVAELERWLKTLPTKGSCCSVAGVSGEGRHHRMDRGRAHRCRT